MNNRKDYSLIEIFSVLLKKLGIIILCIVIGAVGAFWLSNYVLDKVYTATVSMYVAPNQGDTDMEASINDLDYAQQVANTYVEILKSNAFVTDVIKISGLEYSVKEMRKMIKIKIVENTEIFLVQVDTNNPRDSLIIADTITLLAPHKINQIVEVSTLKIVDPAVLPQQATSPSILINTIIGFLLGAIISIMIILIFDMADKRIKDEHDITNNYNINVLGTVSKFIE